MRYRLVLVDVDGTLVCSEQKLPTARTVRALRALQTAGVLVAVCTGRSHIAIRPERLGGFVPDYCICNNGAQGLGRTGGALWEKTFSNRQVEGLIGLFEKNGYALHLNFKDGYYTYVADRERRYLEFYQENNGDMACIKDGFLRDRHLREPALDGWGMLPDEAAARFNETYRDLLMIPFCSGSYDICRTDVSKATGVAKLLGLLGLRWEDAVAIGDGENDVALLEKAGLGIAMGNAPPQVRARADRITGSVLEEGAAAALEQLFWPNTPERAAADA